ncbi:SPC24 Probable kinetochore protein SPC24 [Candida maltosa Xu316]|uniref:Kinetochore protein Spc24 n=1 Tax=Candida maltosa (strain Xu316) TaxID=1245528 RepID=M3HTP0_CANMX|nr:putative kinetochore protein SPC24 [Candida maltosa Xu316]
MSLEKLNLLIEEINDRDELKVIDGINGYIQRLKEIRESKLNQLKTIIQHLNQQITNTTHEINVLNEINDQNYGIIDTSNLNHHNSKSINRSGNVFDIVSQKSKELDDLEITISDQLTILDTKLTGLRQKQTMMLEQLDEINKKSEQIYEDIDKTGIVDQDPYILRISLYKNLGFSLETMNDSMNDMFVITDGSNTTDVLKIEPKLSDYFISNFIWDKM